MPTWSGVLQEINGAMARSGNAVLACEEVRLRYMVQLAAHTRRNVILYATGWTQPVSASPALLSITEEDVQGLMEVVHGLNGADGLDLILHSPGGSPEATEAVVDYLRSKFAHVRVFVPHAAMSAATMLACAADEIVMGKHSFLGPIDPQLIIGNQVAAAQAILDEFELAKADCQDPTRLGAWMPILNQYGPGRLMQCRNALAMAENLVAEWLRTWMLAGRYPGDRPQAARRARAIARKLRDHQKFKSHSRHISRDDARDMGLVVGDLEADQTLQELVLSVYHAVTHAFAATSMVKIIQNHAGRIFIKVPFSLIQPSAGAAPASTPGASV